MTTPPSKTQPVRALCVRCGASRLQYTGICHRCGHRPTGDGLLIAWLLSSEHLSEEQLDAVSTRIEAGESIQPNRAQLNAARRALGRTFATDQGLTRTQWALLVTGSLFLTPLPAWVCWFWWYQTKPRSAWHSLMIAIPSSILLFLTGVVLRLWPWISLMIAAES